ncbi:MAG: hypothetical protein LAP13_00800, partial [Acidobacteriia bacterium]|nr:hypothetical protein [Terriglobia bacterium]
MLTLSGIVARACLYCSSALAVLAATTWNPGWSLHAQNAQNQANEKTAEVTETQPGFKLQVQRNVVPVRVIVRDSKGRAVAGLRQED